MPAAVLEKSPDLPLASCTLPVPASSLDSVGPPWVKEPETKMGNWRQKASCHDAAEILGLSSAIA